PGGGTGGATCRRPPSRSRRWPSCTRPSTSACRSRPLVSLSAPCLAWDGPRPSGAARGTEGLYSRHLIRVYCSADAVCMRKVRTNPGSGIGAYSLQEVSPVEAGRSAAESPSAGVPTIRPAPERFIETWLDAVGGFLFCVVLPIPFYATGEPFA